MSALVMPAWKRTRVTENSAENLRVVTLTTVEDGVRVYCDCHQHVVRGEVTVIGLQFYTTNNAEHHPTLEAALNHAKTPSHA